MACTFFSEVVLRFLLRYGMICILLAKSTGINFNFPNFKACNTDGIICINDTKVSEHVIQLTNNKSDMYKSTNQSIGRVVYNKTFQLSSTVNFSTHFQFTMKSYNVGHVDEGIAFFMSSKATASMPLPCNYGLPKDENGNLLLDVFAIVFTSTGLVGTFSKNLNPLYSKFSGSVNHSLNNGIMWNTWIDYSSTTQQLEVVLSNHSTGSKIHGSRVLLLPMMDLSISLPKYIVVGLSGSAVQSTETHIIHSWSFNTTTQSPKKIKISTKIIAILGSILVIAVVGALLVWGYLAFMQRKKPQVSISGKACTHSDIELHRVLEHGPRRFGLEDLKVATNNFDENQKLGSGGFGRVYRGLLAETKEMVAVKRIAEGSRQGIKEFISEITVVSRVRHRNLVQLLGWCHEKGELLLVYEYMPNRSLDKHIFPKEDQPTLDWNRRYGIARQIASGLLYLHEDWGQCIIHRDVKSSNVMLDCNFSAKLGDFGLARILEHDRLFQTTIPAGTLGFLAPECVTTGKTSPESDVYSFGALALEIASGREAVDLSLAEHNMRLVEWVWDLYGKDRVVDAADVRLNGGFETTEMEQLLEVGLWCSHPDATTRPKMRQVLKMLNFEAVVPHLPTALPKPSYAPIEAATFSTSSSIASSTPMYADVPST